MKLDEGYQFGIGAFETIKIQSGRAVFLQEHVQRMNEALEFLDISKRISQEAITDHMERHNLSDCVLKVMASERNLILQERSIPYESGQYERGFRMDYSEVRRNETSPFTRYKTLNYGENLMEKRKAARRLVDEVIFMNTRGEICEGAVSNIFFIRQDILITPPVSCGLLPGIIRGYLCDTQAVREAVITPAQADECEECFITNSLMGIMPVRRLGEKQFKKRTITDRIRRNYMNEVERYVGNI